MMLSSMSQVGFGGPCQPFFLTKNKNYQTALPDHITPTPIPQNEDASVYTILYKNVKLSLNEKTKIQAIIYESLPFNLKEVVNDANIMRNDTPYRIIIYRNYYNEVKFSTSEVYVSEPEKLGITALVECPIPAIDTQNILNTVFSVREYNLLNGTTIKEKRSLNDIMFKCEKIYPYQFDSFIQSDITNICNIYCLFAVSNKEAVPTMPPIDNSKSKVSAIAASMYNQSIRDKNSKTEYGKQTKQGKYANKDEHIEVIKKNPLLIGKIQILLREEEILLTVLNIGEQKKYEHCIPFADVSNHHSIFKQVLQKNNSSLRVNLFERFRPFMMELGNSAIV